MGTVSKTLNIVANTTYNLAIDLWAWSIWATEAGITTTYSSLANLLADEKAVRQLMTVHKSVDYLANYPSGADRETLNTIINNDICAKWINISDYAYDKLSANANIKSVMNTADKYGYGEWGKIDSTTWGPLGNVPIMTANNAPYGVASASHAYNNTYAAWKLFDRDDSSSWRGDNTSSTEWVQYEFVNPTIVNMMKIRPTVTESDLRIKDYNIKGSNDGTNFTTIYTGSFENDPSLATTDTFIHFTNDVAYKIYRVNLTNTWSVPASGRWNYGIATLQFYGRELKPLVPTMTSNTTPKGEAISASSSSDHDAFKAFDNNLSTYWHSSSGISLPYSLIYDFKSGTRIMMSRLNPLYYQNKCYSKTYKIQGSNTGTSNSWTDLTETITYSGSPASTSGEVTYGTAQNSAFTKNVGTYRYYGLSIISSGYSSSQTGVAELQFYGFDYSEKEFAQGSTRKTIYDHGVAPSGAITGGTKNPDCLTLSAVGTATVTIDKGTRTYMGGKAGLHASGTNRLKCGSGYSAFTASNMPDSNGFDISSISGSVAVGIEQTASGTFDCTEIWLE